MAAGQQHRRTLLLAVLATAALVWSAIDLFDIEAQEMAWWLFYCVVGTVGLIVAAALMVGLMIGLRRLLGAMRGD